MVKVPKEYGTFIVNNDNLTDYNDQRSSSDITGL